LFQLTSDVNTILTLLSQVRLRKVQCSSNILATDELDQMLLLRTHHNINSAEMATPAPHANTVKLNNLTYHCCSLCTIHDLADAKQIQTVHQKNQLSGNIECCIFTEVNIFCGTSDPPNGYVCNEIAYISVIKRWRPTIQNVRSYRDADIGSLSGESKTEASN